MLGPRPSLGRTSCPSEKGRFHPDPSLPTALPFSPFVVLQIRCRIAPKLAVVTGPFPVYNRIRMLSSWTRSGLAGETARTLPTKSIRIGAPLPMYHVRTRKRFPMGAGTWESRSTNRDPPTATRGGIPHVLWASLDLAPGGVVWYNGNRPRQPPGPGEGQFAVASRLLGKMMARNTSRMQSRKTSTGTSTAGQPAPGGDPPLGRA